MRGLSSLVLSLLANSVYCEYHPARCLHSKLLLNQHLKQSIGFLLADRHSNYLLIMHSTKQTQRDHWAGGHAYQQVEPGKDMQGDAFLQL